MALVSHRWPFVTPAALGDPQLLPMHWWIYYVRAARAYADEHERAANDMTRGASRRG